MGRIRLQARILEDPAPRLLATVCLAAALLWPGANCHPEDDAPFEPADSPSTPARGYFTGVLPLPAQGQSVADAHGQAAACAEFVPVWPANVGAAGFWDFADALASPTGREYLDETVRGNGLFPVIQFSFMDRDPTTGALTVQCPPGMSGATLEDPAWREAYRAAVVDVVRVARPRYLSTGNEVNRWYEQEGAAEGDPNGFQHFLSLHAEIYDAVKALSPETQVFFVLAREMVAELREADLSVLDLLDPTRMDLLMMTSYPYAVRKDQTGALLDAPINSPEDIPDDYYARVATRFPDLAFGFTEIGWPSTEFHGGEPGQTDFLLEATGRLTADLPLHLFGWPWLHDAGEDDDLGLRTLDDRPKQGWDTWCDL